MLSVIYAECHKFMLIVVILIVVILIVVMLNGMAPLLEQIVL